MIKVVSLDPVDESKKRFLIKVTCLDSFEHVVDTLKDLPVTVEIDDTMSKLLLIYWKVSESVPIVVEKLQELKRDHHIDRWANDKPFRGF